MNLGSVAIGIVMGVFGGGLLAFVTLEEHARPAALAPLPTDCADRVNAAAQACVDLPGTSWVEFRDGHLWCRSSNDRELRP